MSTDISTLFGKHTDTRYCTQMHPTVTIRRKSIKNGNYLPRGYFRL